MPIQPGPREGGAPWDRYEPSHDAPWDLRRVALLHRRSGFAATADELRRDLVEGPDASVDRVLAGTPRIQGIPSDFERVAGVLADSAVAAGDPARLKAWWVYRMLATPDPLGERLTLMWHDHFATSNDKVADLAAMRAQNETFRTHARAPFGALLNAVVRDPALLIWLDAPANRKGRPNENLARELMELFTLGIGHYSEIDVKEAARALTGSAAESGRFRDTSRWHDDGEKSILGHTGRWSAADLVRVLLGHRATAERLARRVCGLLMGEGVVTAEEIAALAAGLRERALDVDWAVATVLRSRVFFSEANIGTRVLGPVEYVIGSVRALGLFDPYPDPLALANWISRIGQDLFYPPNVGGWPAGRAWLSSHTLVARANFAAALIGGRGVGLPGPIDATGLAGRRGRDDAVALYCELLLPGDPGSARRRQIAESCGSAEAWGPDASRRALTAVLTSPESQLS
jgi:hypothetical protein